MNKEVAEIQEYIVKILKRYQVIRASLFGSIVNGEFTSESDIDILVEFEGKKSLLDLAGLKLELQEKLKREVDVVTFKSLSPHLKDIILAQQVPIL